MAVRAVSKKQNAEFTKRLKAVRARRKALTAAIIEKGYRPGLPSPTDIVLEDRDFWAVPYKARGKRKARMTFYLTLSGLENLARAVGADVP